MKRITNSRKTAIGVLCAGLTLVVTVYAGTIPTPHVAGEFQGWNPGANPMAETFPGSDIWSVTFSGLAANTRYEFKITDGTWGNSIPVENSWLYSGGDGSVTITYDGNTYTDGWYPASDRIGLDTDPGTWTATGNFLSQIGGVNWNNADAAGTMAAQGGGIYALTVTGLLPGSYSWKTVKSGSWDSISSDSRSINTANATFITTLATSNVMLYVDAFNGTVKVDDLNLGSPPPLPSTGSGANVMMQGFYWDCPSGGTWYNTMTANAPSLRSMRGGYGIDRIWFPPPSKADGGGFSMGYDPYDYYDLGQYNQQETTETRFGSQTELKNTIAAFKDLGVVSMADIVLNHRSGGGLESNPNTGGTSYTDFRGVASGQATWQYNEFHPSTFEASDPGAFEGFPDICHVTGNQPGDPHYDLIEWGNWLMDPANAGFDGGWRFDYPKGIHPWYIAGFRAGTGSAFGILEYFDGNIGLIEDYVRLSGNTSAFDFPAFFTMKDVFNYNQDIRWLIDPGRIYAVKDPSKAVTFVANHDTDKDTFIENIGDKMLAYAYILTYEGYPCIFWKDYYNYGLDDLGGQDGNGIDPLVWVRGALGAGQPQIQILKSNDNDFLIYGTQSGSFDSPGYIVAINNNDTVSQVASVTTANTFLHGKELECHAWYSYVSGQNVKPANTTCSAGGTVTVQAPPRGYAVYSVKTTLPGAAWNELDIGNAAGLPGRADYYSDAFKIAGSGSGVDGTADGCYFLLQLTGGDCGIEARVVDLTDPDSAPKAGVMMRPFSANASLMNAAMFVTPEDGVVFQWRSTDSGATSSVSVPGISLPCWVRLIRSGNSFSGFYSTDGSTWTQVGSSQTIAMDATIITGAAVTAGDADKVAIATLDGVSINYAPSMPEIGDEVLLAGETLTITNVASDVDIPAQTLTYSLANPPAGATIGPISGVLEWRPAVDQSPSTQTVSVVVSDDGAPALSSVSSFLVEVLQPAMPTFTSPAVTNGLFGFWVSGDAGPDYSILTSTNLTNGLWLPVFTTNSPVLPFYWSTPADSATQEFFRIELGP
jgi:alpha-amylase